MMMMIKGTRQDGRRGWREKRKGRRKGHGKRSIGQKNPNCKAGVCFIIFYFTQEGMR